MERKEYEAPKVTRIEIGFEDRIIVAGCALLPWDSTYDCEVLHPGNS